MKKTTPGIVPGTALDVNESTCLTTTSLDFILMSSSLFRQSPFWPPRWERERFCWEEFYRHAINKALKYTKNDWYLAKDAVQEAAIHCTKNYGTIYSDPKWWCLNVVRNKSTDLIRKRNRKSLTLDYYPPSNDDSQGNSTPSPLEVAADQAPTPDQELEKAEAQCFKQNLVERIIASLLPKDRHVVESYYINEESLAEIAARLQTKENAVECQLYRIRKRLREQFSKEIAASQ